MLFLLFLNLDQLSWKSGGCHVILEVRGNIKLSWKSGGISCCPGSQGHYHVIPEDKVQYHGKVRREYHVILELISYYYAILKVRGMYRVILEVGGMYHIILEVG